MSTARARTAVNSFSICLGSDSCIAEEGALRLLAPCWCMEVGWLVRDPSQESLYVLPLPQYVQIGVFIRQLMIGNMRMDRAMTDWMDRHGFVSTLALRHAVVPLHSCPQQAMAQRANRLCRALRTCGARFHLSLH